MFSVRIWISHEILSILMSTHTSSDNENVPPAGCYETVSDAFGAELGPNAGRTF